MTQFAKRFRSKAPSAASLSPGQPLDRQRMGFGFLFALYYDTVSKEKKIVHVLFFVKEGKRELTFSLLWFFFVPRL